MSDFKTRAEFIQYQMKTHPTSPSINVDLPMWVSVGKNVTIFAGAFIGNSGFGFFKTNKKNILIPHAGKVKIGDDCVIFPGAHIIRATAEWKSTILEDNVFVDAMVHVAHNCVIGTRTQIVAGTILGGSCNIGKDVSIGTGVSFVDHITVADGILIGSGAHVTKDLTKPNWIYADKVSESGMVYAQPIRERTEKDVL